METGVRHDGRCAIAPAAAPTPRRPLLVAALITKNEEHHLAACLESLVGAVDDVVICDTGSSDTTVAIAREAGATVVEHPWRSDFGWARNQALSAVGDADWILWIDADERLVGDVAALRLGLRAMPSDIRALAVPVTSRRHDGPTSVGLAQRVFRPTGARFEGAIHEEVVDDSSGIPLAVAAQGLLAMAP